MIAPDAPLAEVKAAVEVTKTGTDVSFRWRLGDSTVVHPGGSIDCP